MMWKKKGLIYNVDGSYNWNKSHAQCPVVDVISDSVWRIYYATRNNAGQSQISYKEVEAGNPKHILYEHDRYLFDLGKLGAFSTIGDNIISRSGNQIYHSMIKDHIMFTSHGVMCDHSLVVNYFKSGINLIIG